MDLYHKPTDTERYVPFNSNHPPHCKKNIPFTLARRICTIVESEEKKQEHLKKLKENLRDQKYPKEIIDTGISKALNIPQSELRTPRNRSDDEEKILPFVTTYNPNNPQIFKTIKESFSNLQNTVPGFNELKLIHSRRQAPNLKRILTKAEFSQKKAMVSRCGKPRCECCDHILVGDQYTFKNVNYRFEIKTPMSCDSYDVEYVVICDGCGEEYIGETGEGQTVVRDRVRVYRQHIRDKKYQKLSVEEHIRECGGGKFKIFPFLQLRTGDTNLRRAFEKKFQQKFKTKLN